MMTKCATCGDKIDSRGIWRHNLKHERERAATPVVKKAPASAEVAHALAQNAELNVVDQLKSQIGQIDLRLAWLMDEKAKLNNIQNEISQLQEWKTKLEQLVNVPSHSLSKAGD